MAFWNLVQDRLVINRKEDEAFYAAALGEFQSGQIRAGLMAKAMAESEGDEQKAKSSYIRLLAAAIRDDHYLHNRTTEEMLRAARRIEAENYRAPVEEARVAPAKVFRQEPQQNDRGGWLWSIVVIGGFGWWILSGFFDDSKASRDILPPTSPTQAAPSQYQLLLEANPGLIPESSHYNKPFADRVMAKAELHSRAGKSPEDALRQAIFDESAAPRQTVRNNKPRSTATAPAQGQPCVYKAVMTDDDYRACGIRPPEF